MYLCENCGEQHLEAPVICSHCQFHQFRKLPEEAEASLGSPDFGEHLQCNNCGESIESDTSICGHCRFPQEGQSNLSSLESNIPRESNTSPKQSKP